MDFIVCGPEMGGLVNDKVSERQFDCSKKLISKGSSVGFLPTAKVSESCTVILWIKYSL